VKLKLQPLATGLALVYVLRVPLFVWLTMLALPLVAVPRGAAAGPLLRGLFDLSDPFEHGPPSDRLTGAATSSTVPLVEHAIEGSAFALVTLAALMAAASVGFTARLIIRDGPERFRMPSIPTSAGVELLLRVLLVIPPLFVVGGAVSQSAGTVAPATCVVGIAVGLAAFVCGAGPVQRTTWQRIFGSGGENRPTTILTAPVRGLLGLFEWVVARTPAGFVDPRSGRLRARHVFAWFQVLLSAALYVLLFFFKLKPVSTYIRIPTLCDVLLLAMILCWTLSALSFILDRFRIPVTLVLAAYGTAISIFPQGDHFFPSLPRKNPTHSVLPADVLKRRADRPAIVVAAMGGGIHAGAWVAHVLAGLQDDSVRCGDGDFDQALAMISGVSGGSMGAMYIVDAYDGGRLRKEALSRAVKASEGSSLDDIAWALTYPDLIWTVAPFLKGISFSDGLHVVAGRNLVLDRGTALENSWKRTDTLKDATLDAWRRDVERGIRPAVIFNSTIVETGDRLLLGTTTIDGTIDNKKPLGRVDFSTDPNYAGADVLVATAARLSSTFPYVSPPARIQRNSVFDYQFHVVDGGYFDNYGTVTLVEWLTEALAGETSLPSQVLLLEIRTFPAGGDPTPDNRRGWIFEATHPLFTLFHVREAAQRSTADVAAGLLTSFKSGRVSRFVLQFPDRVYQGFDDVSPTQSWHLTPRDKYRITVAWKDPSIVQARRHVHQFLTGRDGSGCIA
jgi:hypothetical protein